jgi:hypothetical protein
MGTLEVTRTDAEIFLKLACSHVLLRSVMTEEENGDETVRIFAVTFQNDELGELDYHIGTAGNPECFIRHLRPLGRGDTNMTQEDWVTVLMERMEIWKTFGCIHWWLPKPAIACKATPLSVRSVYPGNPFILQHYACMTELIRPDITHCNWRPQWDWALYLKLKAIIAQYNKKLRQAGLGLGIP